MYYPRKIEKICVGLALFGFCAVSVAKVKVNEPMDQLPPDIVANYLGWVKSPDNICGGRYVEPSIVAKYPHPAGIKKEKITATAKLPGLFSLRGDSVLRGDVNLSQFGRQIVADKIILHRNKKTGRLISADLIGHVQLREYGKVLVGDHAFVNFVDRTFVLNHVIYHIASVKLTNGVDSWGRASRVRRDKQGVLTLDNATYSTCQPFSCAWYFKGKKIRLNKQAGTGWIKDAKLYFHGIPTLYLPYFKFPIDKRRKSGFLYPNISFSSKSGADISVPYYFNLAPNYDATITPRIISKRGFFLSGMWRYITKASHGAIHFAYIFHDMLFEQYKRDEYIPHVHNPLLDELEKSSSNRGSFSLTNTDYLNKHWSTNLHLNYVTDDYFLRDFSHVPSVMNNNQLLNRADLRYGDDHWQFLARLQAFQTLHQLTQHPDSSLDQYRRLPELDLNGFFPHPNGGLNYQLHSQFVYFDHALDFFTKKPVVTGARLDVAPGIDWNYKKDGVYFHPALQLDTVFYSLQHQPVRNSANLVRVLPLFNLDTGLTFERNISLLGKSYTQTLEPRLFYLFVPATQQNNIPLFDSDISPFSFASLFRTNRFDGVDRIGDANQVSLALTNRFIDTDTGEQKVRISFGEIIALHQHKICIPGKCDLDPLTRHDVSPFIGEIEYALNKNWNVTSDLAWNFYNKRINNAGVTFQYRYGNKGLFNVGYNFVEDGDSFVNKTVDLNRLDLSVAMPLMQRWRVLGDWSYNFSSKSSQEYLYGLEYNSCCWGLQFVVSRVCTGYDSHNHGIFDRRYYIQFALKSLGNLGTSGIDGLLTSRIPGFTSNLATGIIK